VLIVPYFLHTGVLVKRIAEQAVLARGLHNGVEIAVGRHLGAHDRLVQLIVDRAAALEAGDGE
jgi:sirohydrochlorin cobaltochelatase